MHTYMSDLLISNLELFKLSCNSSYVKRATAVFSTGSDLTKSGRHVFGCRKKIKADLALDFIPVVHVATNHLQRMITIKRRFPHAIAKLTQACQ